MIRTLITLAMIGSAQAGECRTITSDDFQTKIAKAGGEVVGGVVFDGKNSDLILVYEVDGIVAMMAFREGCALPISPLGIDYMRPKVGV